MKGNSVIVTADPMGRFEGCIVSGTPKPGTCMEIVPATNPISGRFTYRVWSANTGAAGPTVVLMEDNQQGFTINDAYVSGRHGRLYWPLPGDELNLWFRQSVGTGTANQDDIGDRVSIEKNTGLLMAFAAATLKPFYVMEKVATETLGTDAPHWVKFLGSYA